MSVLEGINKDLEIAIKKFIDANKTLDRGYRVNIVDFLKESVVAFSGIDDRQFELDEIWEIDNFKMKIVKIVDLDGECFLRLKQMD